MKINWFGNQFPMIDCEVCISIIISSGFQVLTLYLFCLDWLLFIYFHAIHYVPPNEGELGHIAFGADPV